MFSEGIFKIYYIDSCKYTIKRINNEQVYFIIFVHIRIVLLKQISQSFHLTILWSESCCSLGAPEPESFRTKINEKITSSSTPTLCQLLMGIQSIGKTGPN